MNKNCKLIDVYLYFFRYYQVRTSLRTPAKTPVKVEVSLPRNSGESISVHYQRLSPCYVQRDVGVPASHIAILNP